MDATGSVDAPSDAMPVDAAIAIDAVPADAVPADAALADANATDAAPADAMPPVLTVDDTPGQMLLSPGADATVSENDPTVNYGAEHYLHVTDDPDNLAFVRFDIFPPGTRFDRIDHARLVLHPQPDSDGEIGNSYAVHRALGDWQETAITWNNRPAHASAAREPYPAAFLPFVYIDVTDIVRSWNLYPDTNHGFVIQSDEGYPLQFASRENLDANEHPARLELTVNANVTSLEPSRDTFVRRGDPDANFGAGTLLDLDEGPDVTGGFTRVLLDFDLSVLPGGSQVYHAELVMERLSGQLGNSGHAYAIFGPWAENSVTWNNQPNHASPVYGYRDTGPQNSPTEHRWNLSRLAQYWHDGTFDHGVVLRDHSESSSFQRNATFGSREHATVASRPRLLVYHGP